MSVPRRFTEEETITFTFQPKLLRTGWHFLVWDVPTTFLLSAVFVDWPVFQYTRDISWEPHERLWIFIAVTVGLAVVFLVWALLARVNGMPCWTLRGGERTIIRSFSGLWNREWTLNAGQARFCAVRFGFWARMYTFGIMKTLAEYQIEIESGGQTLLFPCRDEAEQRLWLGMIESFRKSTRGET